MAITQRTLTLEQFLQLPEAEPALEYIDGVVTQKVSPHGPHSTAQYRIAERINRYAEPRKLAFAFPELREIFDGASPVPDISVFRWDRIPRDERGRPRNRFTAPPDIAIEIASPGQSVRALIARCRWYVEHDVLIAILVRTGNESVTVVRPGQPDQVLRGNERIDLTPILPGFELAGQELFDSFRLE
jgi:Uma2 family endonuclease